MDTAANTADTADTDTSVLNMTQPISKVAWKRHTKSITDADTAVNVSNTSMKKAALEVPFLVPI